MLGRNRLTSTIRWLVRVHNRCDKVNHSIHKALGFSPAFN